jgi:hypothetical protein
VISLETWAEIRYLYGSEGLSQRAIARRLGISRDTVARAIASGSPPKYVRVSGPSAFDPFEPRVRELLTQFPTMPTSVIAERVGWAGSQSWFRKKVALLRPRYAPKDPADRLSYRPGDQAQCDLWFPPARIPLGGGQVDAPPVLVMVSSFSRFITAAMIPSRQTPDLVAGMWSLLAGQFGAVRRRLLWDNETGVGRRGRLVAAVVAFTGALATKVVQLPPYDPESKGIVERANGYLETSFLPGRTFVSPTDFNAQLTEWLPRANARRVRGLGSGLDAVPAELISTDRAAIRGTEPARSRLARPHRSPRPVPATPVATTRCPGDRGSTGARTVLRSGHPARGPLPTARAHPAQHSYDSRSLGPPTSVALPARTHSCRQPTFTCERGPSPCPHTV